MSNYTATVIKSGNSYALRIPKSIADEKHLVVGQKVAISDITKEHAQDHQKVIEAMHRLQEMQPFSGIKDPVAWQREIRKDRKLPYRD
ncbi:MAG: hypothetical protein AAB914_02025 [Patescibacteria group bacterium]